MCVVVKSKDTQDVMNDVMLRMVMKERMVYVMCM